MASATGLSYAVFLNLGASIRSPPVSVRLGIGRHSSCAYPPEYNTSSGWIGSGRPGEVRAPPRQQRGGPGRERRGRGGPGMPFISKKNDTARLIYPAKLRACTPPPPLGR